VRFALANGLRYRFLEDEAVVFDPVSWDAHLLNPAAIAVLQLLHESPKGEGAIIAFLAEAMRPEEQAQAPTHARRLISQLQSLGLILPFEVA
jgi:PqqD family protein of HPr-rel-A system